MLTMLYNFYISHQNPIKLIIGTILCTFSLGLFNISIMILIWPYLFLSYLHHNTEESKKKPILLVSLCLLISNLIKWIGYSNVIIFIDFVFGLYNTLISILPFLIDYLLYNKISKWKSVFLFPLVLSSIEYIFSFIPICNINLYALSQVDNIVISQILSLFGMYFLSFILALFASLLDYVVEFYKKEKKIHSGIYWYLLVVIICYIYGGIYLQIKHNNEKIKIVSVLGISQADLLKNEDEEFVLRNLTEYIDYIQNKTLEAKSIKADLITFAEEAFHIKQKDYEYMKNETLKIAKENNIFMSVGFDVEIRKDKEVLNTNILITNKGELLYDYTKHHPIPVAEIEYKKGKEKLKVFNTEIGRITNVICYDLNFPYFMNYIGFKHPDLVIAPSWDYEAVAEFQAKGTRYKAIENGFNIIKNTAAGITIGCDYNGRFLTYYKTDETADYFIVSDLNKHGIKTLYSYIGLLFNIVYIIGIFVVIFLPDKNKSVFIEQVDLNEQNIGDIPAINEDSQKELEMYK